MSDKTLIEWNADVGTRFLTIYPDGSFHINENTPPLYALGELAKAFMRQQDRIQRLEEQLMDAKNKYAVLVADVVLNEDRADRIKRLEEALDKTTKIASQRIKRLEDSYAAKDAQLSNLLNICRANGIDVSSQDLIHGKEDKL